MIEIFGSTTSPFVRRLRMLIHGRDIHFRSVTLQQDREFIIKLSPIGKIPILKDGDQIVWDSRQIAQFLFDRWKLPALSWDEENFLTAISELGDSMVTLYYMQEAGLVDRQNKFNARHWERVSRIYDFAQQQLSSLPTLRSGQWNFVSMTLYALIDWADFRKVVELKNYPALLAWRSQFSSRADVMSTDPRL